MMEFIYSFIASLLGSFIGGFLVLRISMSRLATVLVRKFMLNAQMRMEEEEKIVKRTNVK